MNHTYDFKAKTQALFIRLIAVTTLLALCGLPALAQNPTAVVTGKIKDQQGDALPGVLITAQSDAVQGERTATSDVNGSFKFGFLPAGLYKLVYTLDGFQPVEQNVRVNAGQAEVVDDVSLSISDLSEAIVVTGNLETVALEGAQATTILQSELEMLPVARNITEAVDLVPGVHRTGPVRSGSREGNISIMGSMSFENLYTVNGIVVNENLRGQPLDLFIEDAIQEQTVTTGNVSAEFGRFTGGIVNVLTKSGGNQFKGSVRVNQENQDWESPTRFTVSQEDKTNDTYEATLGGRILEDKLWFFGAFRDFDRSRSETTPRTLLSFQEERAQTRIEGKLTANLSQSHTLVGSYLDIDDMTNGDTFGDVLELSALSNREDPQKIWSLNYNGMFGSKVFVEAQYSERELLNGIGSGGPRDIIRGASWETVIDNSSFGAPSFCGECEEEKRANDNTLIKASYFLSTNRAGTHDIVFGYDTFTDITFDVNHQSGNDFRLAADDVLIDSNTGQVFPVLDPNGSAWVSTWPVFGLDNVRDTDFKTNSFFVNDRWQLNDNWSLNLGLRYDENDGRDAGGAQIANDSKISPRLGFDWDIKGDGQTIMHGAWGRYVSALANTRADDTATGGAIGRAILFWGGQPINTDAGCLARGDCIGTEEATEIVMNWWLDTTGFNPLTDPPENIASIPGAQFLAIPGTETNRAILGGLKSPSADDYSLGLTQRLGRKGALRADVVYRKWEDFYADRISLATGQVTIQGQPFDFEQVGNFDDELSREYLGLHLNFRYKITDRLDLATAYALSESKGNVNGETTNSGPIAGSPQEYAEYKAFSQWNPEGRLGGDQTHKIRAWAIYNIFDTQRHNLTVSWLQRFNSGTPYGASGAVDSRPFVNNPGYISPPQQVTYFFTERDAFKTDDVTQSDISFNYTFKVGNRFEIFLQPEMLNVFDEDTAFSVDNTVNDGTTGGAGLAAFNPYTETPTEGVHWQKGADFGKPQGENDLQTPRTFRFSVGFRF